MGAVFFSPAFLLIKPISACISFFHAVIPRPLFRMIWVRKACPFCNTQQTVFRPYHIIGFSRSLQDAGSFLHDENELAESPFFYETSCPCVGSLTFPPFSESPLFFFQRLPLFSWLDRISQVGRERFDFKNPGLFRLYSVVLVHPPIFLKDFIAVSPPHCSP